MKWGISTILSRVGHRYGPHFGIATQGYVRCLGLIFVLSFWSFAAQATSLSGARGLLPAVPAHVLLGVCGVGVVTGLMMLYGFFPWFSTLLSLLSYGLLLQLAGYWLNLPGDRLLMEMAVPALFLVPIWKRSYPPLHEASSRLTGILWVNFLLCKVLLGSGLAQLFSPDKSWREAIAFFHFFETQSLPAIPGWYLHHLPGSLLEYFVWGLVFIEVVLPFYVVMPRTFRNILAGGAALISIVLLLTSHHGFLPLQILLLAFALVDDVSWRIVLPDRFGPRASTTHYRPSPVTIAWLAGIGAVFFLQSLPLVQLPGEKYVANLNLSNRYFLFQEVPQKRLELSLQGSLDGKQWVEYRFNLKPTDPRSLPKMSILHHPRLDDRLVSFAREVNMEDGAPQVEPPRWYLNLVARLLEGDPVVQQLIPVNPFPEHPPRFLRWVVYEYRFADPVTRREQDIWWVREPLGIYGPVFSREGVIPIPPAPPAS